MTADQIAAIRADCDEEFVAVCDATASDQVRDVLERRRGPPCPQRLPNLLISGGEGGYGERPTQRPVQARRAIGLDGPAWEEVIPLTDAIWATREWNPRVQAWTWRH